MLVKVRFKNGTVKEISEHLAIKPELQKAQGFEIINDEGEVIHITQPTTTEKKNAEVAEVVQSVAEIVEPKVVEPVEIVSPLDEVSEDIQNEPKKRGRKPKV